MSVPLWLGSDGVEGIREWELTDDERRSLSEAAASLRSTLDL
jgi:malate/lactate dehydrogenase